jgi:hypothetical protein
MIGSIAPETPWEVARHGKLTASKISTLFTEPKLVADKKAGKLSDTALKYIREKAAEIVTGTYRAFENYATEWGNTYEPEAALLIKDEYPDFEYTGKDFLEFTDWSGGSRDGFIKSELAVVEIKCPENPENHLLYCTIDDGQDLREEKKDYWYQIQFNIACVAKHLGIDPMTMKGLFVSYSPMPNPGFKKFHKVWVEPDQEFHNTILSVIEKATNELFNQVKLMKHE